MMKLELKTENKIYPKSILYFFGIVLILALITIIFNVAFKLGMISRHYQVDYNCRLLSVEKSATKFKKLSRLSDLRSKQEIWEFCREIIK